MTCYMPRDVFLDAAFFRYNLDTVFAIDVARHG